MGRVGKSTEGCHWLLVPDHIACGRVAPVVPPHEFHFCWDVAMMWRPVLPFVRGFISRYPVLVCFAVFVLVHWCNAVLCCSACSFSAFLCRLAILYVCFSVLFRGSVFWFACHVCFCAFPHLCFSAVTPSSPIVLHVVMSGCAYILHVTPGHHPVHIECKP